MDAVRAAMGDEQLSYLGFSYGTAIGQVYADLFPERVRSMVLDGVLELGPTGLELGRRAGRRLRDGARPVRRVLRRRRGLRDRRRRRSRRSRRCSPSPRSPAASRRPTPTGPPGPGEANLGIGYALYSQSLWGQPRRRRSPTPLDGDGSELVDLADGYLGIGDFEIYFAVNCLDFAWPTGDPDAFFAAAKATAETSPALR